MLESSYEFKYLYGVLIMKKVLLVLLAMIMVLSMMTSVIAMPSGKIPPGQAKKAAAAGLFDDVGGFEWAQEEIEFMAQKGVIKGIGGGKFVPNRSAKEIEVIIMLLRLINEEEGLDMEADLPDDYEGGEYDEWMIPYITLAEEEGILTMEGLKKINPNSAASREEVAMYIMMALDAFELETNDDIEGDLEELFEDADNVDQEYLEYVHRIRMSNLMIGFNGKFQPKKAITRAELAVLMNRIFVNFELDWLDSDNDNGKEATTGILVDIDYDHTTIEAITLDIDDDPDDVDFEEFDDELEIEIENNCCKDAEDELDDIDDDKYLDLEVDVYEEDGVVTKIVLHYVELQGKLDLSEEQEDDFANIDPIGSKSTTEYPFDGDIEIFMNGETMTADDFDDDDNDFEFHDVDDFDYEVEARLLGNGDLIGLCISSEYKGELTEFDYDDSENELLSITVEIDGKGVKFNLAEDCEIDPDNNLPDDLEEIDDANDDVKFKVNGENEVIELDLN